MIEFRFLQKGKDLGKECFRMSYLCLFNDLYSKPHRLIILYYPTKGCVASGEARALFVLLSQNIVQVLTLSIIF